MQVKKVIVAQGIELYFCPKCNKGHLLEKGQEECDICHTKLEWNEKKESEK